MCHWGEDRQGCFAPVTNACSQPVIFATLGACAEDIALSKSEQVSVLTKRAKGRSGGFCAVGLLMGAILAGPGAVSGPAWAQSPPAPPPFAEFTFKRIGVGDGAPGRRITVQIAPAGAAPAITAPTPQVQTAPQTPTTRHAAFWTAISPALIDSGPGRLPEAVRALGAGPGVPAPPLQQIRGLSAQHGANLLRHSVGTQVSPALALAVMSVESAGRAEVVSAKGAVGLMQLMPQTAAEVGVTDRADPEQSIRGGIAYLDKLMARFDRDPVLVLAAYNAGPGAVERAGGVPDFPETRDFVPKVLAAWTVARALCLTPPELISDGCVFAPMGG